LKILKVKLAIDFGCLKFFLSYFLDNFFGLSIYICSVSSSISIYLLSSPFSNLLSSTSTFLTGTFLAKIALYSSAKDYISKS